jgi:hypothetical protein
VFPGRQRNIWADSHVSIAPFHSLACLGKSLDNSLVFTCVSLYSRSETLHLAAYPARDRAVRRVWHGVLTAYGSEGWGFESLRARTTIIERDTQLGCLAFFCRLECPSKSSWAFARNPPAEAQGAAASLGAQYT